METSFTERHGREFPEAQKFTRGVGADGQPTEHLEILQNLVLGLWLLSEETYDIIGGRISIFIVHFMTHTI